MKTSPEEAELQQRRKATRKQIEKMLAQRQRVLVLMCEVLGLKPYTAHKPEAEVLHEFCAALVDYVAIGHFSLYHRILEGKERRRAVTDAASRVYARIAITTEAAIEFNDRYGGEWDFHMLDNLAEALSKLGEQLALRVDLEDQMIISMLGDAVLRELSKQQ